MSTATYNTAAQLKAAIAQMHRITAAAKKSIKNSTLPLNILSATQSELYFAVHKLFFMCQAQAWPRVLDPQEASHLSAIISKFTRCSAVRTLVHSGKNQPLGDTLTYTATTRYCLLNLAASVASIQGLRGQVCS